MKPNVKSAAGIVRSCFLFLCLSGWYGCSPSLYTPNMVNTPLLSEQGNLKINAAVSLGENVALYNNNLQLAYAATDHLGIMLNGMYHNFQRTQENLFTTDGKGRHKEYFVEAGLGYFAPLHTANRWRWEAYGGYGLGKTVETWLEGDFDASEAVYRRAFVQPGIGWVHPNFEIGLSCRLAYVDIGTITSTDADIHNRRIDGLTFEPALTVRGGFRVIKPFIQYAQFWPSSSLTDALGIDAVLAQNFSFRIGLQVNIQD